MNIEKRKQISGVLNGLGEGLDITSSEYQKAVDSYQAVGNWLAAEGSPLAPYEPEILPQGSFLLGTMTRPINEKDDLDIDLVCRLSGLKFGWTQYNLKHEIGNRLKDHGIYKGLLQPEGRRNWTLRYAEERSFHMDILPAVVEKAFYTMLEKSMSDEDMQRARELGIRITDTRHQYYRSSSDLLSWPSSNMFGFAAWFKYRSQVTHFRKALVMNEAIQPVPKLLKNKLPLQRIVQILKRHRDIMFNGHEHKPISIIITTLAARAYDGEDDILTALINVVNKMEQFIDKRWDSIRNQFYCWICNPVNPTENFADKWPLCDEKRQNFFKWLDQVKEDVGLMSQQENIMGLRDSIERPFGPDLVKSVFNNIGMDTRMLRERAQLYMAAGTGMLGSSGRTQVPNHNFHGSNE